MRQDSVLLMGLEADGDSINSFNFSGGVRTFALGVHARNRGAGYVDLDLRPAKQRWSLSIGAREEIFSGGARACFRRNWLAACAWRSIWSCAPAAATGSNSHLRRSLLFRSVDAQQSQPHAGVGLVSEWTRIGSVGKAFAFRNRILLAAARHYRLRASKTVPNPYLPAGCPANIWCADDLNGFGFSGVETRLTWIPKKSQTVRIAWTGVHGAQSALHGLESESCSITRCRIFMLRGAPRWATNCADQCRPDRRALSANRISSLERNDDPRRGKAAALFTAHEPEQVRLPGNYRRQYAAAHRSGRGCPATGRVKAPIGDSTRNRHVRGHASPLRMARRAEALHEPKSILYRSMP